MSQAPAALDWGSFFRGCTSCAIFCHAGCPDGLGAARLAWRAAEALGVAGLRIVELWHTDRADKAAELFGPSAAVLYVDISPYEEDLPLLRRAAAVAVIDHHASARERCGRVAAALPSLHDLSCLDDFHCACSLVVLQMRELLVDRVPELDRKVALLRKKDVWEYVIPAEWADDAEAFRGFCGAARHCTLAMIDEFLEDLPACLAKGRAAGATQRKNSEECFARMRCVCEEEGLKICALAIDAQMAYNSRDLLHRCKAHNPAILLVVKPAEGSKVVRVDVKRTSDAVGDLGDFCRRLYEADAAVYGGGGGHPFAAGLQVNAQHFELGRVSKDLLHVALPSRRAREPTGAATAAAAGPVEAPEAQPVKRARAETGGGPEGGAAAQASTAPAAQAA